MNSTRDWTTVYERYFGPAPDTPLTYEAVRALETPAGASPLTMQQLHRFLEEHEQARIITDTKERTLDALNHIAREMEVLQDRIIPQIYTPEQADPVLRAGYRSFIWTLYRYPDRRNVRALLDEVRSLRDRHGESFMAVTMPVELVEAGFARAVSDQGVPVYAHTINHCTEAARMNTLGVSALYTDLTSVLQCSP